MKDSSLRYALILLAVATGALGLASCSKKPASKQDATKQIITELLDNCKAGRNEEVASLRDRIMPAKDKQRMKKDRIDYSNPEDRSQIDGMCRQLNNMYGEGYEFGKFDAQAKSDGSEIVGWEVFPKGGKEGQILAFTLENDKYVLVDIDPARR